MVNYMLTGDVSVISFLYAVNDLIPKPVTGDFHWKCCGRPVPVDNGGYPSPNTPCPVCLSEVYFGNALNIPTLRARKDGKEWIVGDHYGSYGRTNYSSLPAAVRAIKSRIKASAFIEYKELLPVVSEYGPKVWEIAATGDCCTHSAEVKTAQYFTGLARLLQHVPLQSTPVRGVSWVRHQEFLPAAILLNKFSPYQQDFNGWYIPPPPHATQVLTADVFAWLEEHQLTSQFMQVHTMYADAQIDALSITVDKLIQHMRAAGMSLML